MSEYLRENVHYTFSGFNFTPTFLDLLLHVGVDRIMFSGRPPLCIDGASACISRSVAGKYRRQRAIAHGNAERLLRL